MTLQIDREELKSRLQSKRVKIIFKKADLSMRTLYGTLRQEDLPDYVKNNPKPQFQEPKKINEQLMAVWDLQNRGWRSFRIDSLESIQDLTLNNEVVNQVPIE